MSADPVTLPAMDRLRRAVQRRRAAAPHGERRAAADRDVVEAAEALFPPYRPPAVELGRRAFCCEEDGA